MHVVYEGRVRDCDDAVDGRNDVVKSLVPYEDCLVEFEIAAIVDYYRLGDGIVL